VKRQDADNTSVGSRIKTVPVVLPRLLAGSLKAARRQYGLSVRQAADIAGVSAATYSRLERQISEPDVETLIRLSIFILALQNRRTNGRR
jgi:DNA-binding XRE family transcriptional regulator